jgi:hypothetical protein
MTSPAPLYLSLDTRSLSGAFTAPAAAEAVTSAAPGITSWFIHADQREPTRRERGHATRQLAGPAVSGFPPAGRALGALRAPSKPRGATTGWRARCCADPPGRKPRHHLVENPSERRAV